MRRLAIPFAAAIAVAATATLAFSGSELSAPRPSPNAQAVPALIAASTNPRARSIVLEQIEAIQQDDARSAYRLTADSVRQAFPTGDAFMTMIRTYYPAMHRPRAVALGPYGETPIGSMQVVFIAGADGSNWVAYFQLEEQPDGTMRVSGCTMMEDDMPMI